MHKTTLLKILSLAVLPGVPGLYSQEPVQMEEAIRQALANNKELSIARMEVERAKSRLLWSGRLPNPELKLSGTLDTLGNGEGEHNFAVGISQRYPRTTRLRAEKDLRLSQVFLAEAEVLEHSRNLAATVAETIVAIAASESNMEHGREHAGLQRVILDTLEAQVARGEASQLDLAQARLALRHTEQRTRNFIANRNQHRLRLQQLLGLPPDTAFTLEYPLDLPPGLPESEIPEEAILRNRPDHLLAIHNTKVAGGALALEREKQRQGSTYSLFIEQERVSDEPVGLVDNTFVGFGVSIPLPIRQKNEGNIALAEIGLEEAGLREDASRFNILSQYKAAWQLYKDNWETAQAASGDILEAAHKNYDDSRIAYLDGQIGLLQVQLAQEQLLELEHESIEAIFRYHQSLVQLRKTTGKIIPANLP